MFIISPLLVYYFLLYPSIFFKNFLRKKNMNIATAAIKKLNQDPVSPATIFDTPSYINSTAINK